MPDKVVMRIKVHPIQRKGLITVYSQIIQSMNKSAI